MKVLILNGPNINMLGIREVNIYGEKTYKDLLKEIKKTSKELKIKVKVKQSNYEGKLVSYIQHALNKYDYIIINAGAYTHTSIAILDALKAINAKVIEVHLSKVDEREDFRKTNYIREIAIKSFSGKQILSYIDALNYVSKFK